MKNKMLVIYTHPFNLYPRYQTLKQFQHKQRPGSWEIIPTYTTNPQTVMSLEVVSDKMIKTMNRTLLHTDGAFLYNISISQIRESLEKNNVIIFVMSPNEEINKYFEEPCLIQLQDPTNPVKPATGYHQIVDREMLTSVRLLESYLGLRSEKPLLLVDFDGVIHSYKTPWNGDQSFIPDGLIPGAREALKNLRKTYRVKIFTVRAIYPYGRSAVEAWLEKQGIEHDGVTATKEYAHAYVDDNAVRFQDWNRTLSFLDKLKEPKGV